MADDFGTGALIQHWRRLQERQIAAAVASASGASQVLGIGESVHVIDVPAAELILAGQPPTVVVSLPELLLGATLVEKGSETDDGDIVVAVTPVFRRPTTSTFAPGVYTEFEPLFPGRISLRNGEQLREWLHLFVKS